MKDKLFVCAGGAALGLALALASYVGDRLVVQALERRTQRLEQAMLYTMRVANYEEWQEVKDRLDMLPYQMRCAE